jgi:hypothetical protein
MWRTSCAQLISALATDLTDSWAPCSPVDRPVARVVGTYDHGVRWQRLFDDLEEQLSIERAHESRELERESQRLHAARSTLRDRLLAMPADAVIAVDLGNEQLRARVAWVVQDAVVVELVEQRDDIAVVPLASIDGFFLADSVAHGVGSRIEASSSPLHDRMTLGFLVREAARRRMPSRVLLANGRTMTGTIDRAGADHLEIALHDAGQPRRQSTVSGSRTLAFAAIACIRFEESPYRGR